MKPRVYEFIKNGRIKSVDDTSYPYTWYPQTILNILNNEVYLERMICNKQQTKSYKDRSLMDIPKNEWIVTKDVHVPIINEEIFDKVQKLMSTKPKRRNVIHSHLFKSKIYCNDCGKAMTYSVDKRRKNYKAYVCSSYRVYGKSRCTTHHIRYEEVKIQDNELLKKIYFNIRSNKDSLIGKCLGEDRWLDERNLDESIMETNRYRKETVSTLLKNLYEDFTNNKISQDVFNELSRQYRDEQKYLENRIQNHIDKTLEVNKRRSNIIETIDNVLSFDYSQKLSKEVVDRLIDKVIIKDGSGKKYRGNRVRIDLKNIGEIELP